MIMINNRQKDRGNENPTQHIPWWLRKTRKKNPVILVGTGIWTTDLPHTSPTCFHCATSLGSKWFYLVTLGTNLFENFLQIYFLFSKCIAQIFSRHEWPPLWSRDNIVTSHAAGLGSIPGRVNIQGDVFSGKWKVLPHAPCSPDMSPPDFDLFPKLKGPMRGRLFLLWKSFLPTLLELLYTWIKM